MLSNLRNEALIEKLERAKAKTQRQKNKVSWPDRHLPDLKGSPVPFHEAQALAWDSTRRIVAYIAGTQIGKTTFGPVWLNREIETRGPGDYLAITSSFDLFRLKFLPALLEYFEHILKVGRFWAGDKILELADPETGEFLAKRATDHMWGRIILRSAQALGGLESATAKGAILDEAGQDEFPIGAYRAIRRRLTLNRGRLFIPTTLYTTGSWVVSEIIKPAMKTGITKTLTIREDAEIDYTDSAERDTTVIQADSLVNPAFPRSEYEEAKRDLPKDVFEMQYRGRVTRPRHMIYDCFDEDIHLCPRFKIPDEWKRYLGLDFGGANTAAFYVAEEPKTHKLYVYRIYHHGKKSAKEHVEDMMFGEPGRPKCYGGAPGEGQWRQEFRDAGLPVREPKISDVWLGINRFYALLKKGTLDPETGTRDGDVAIQFFDDLDALRTEITSYHRKTDQLGNPIQNEIAAKSTFHVLDAGRYVLSSVDLDHKVLVATA